MQSVNTHMRKERVTTPTLQLVVSTVDGDRTLGRNDLTLFMSKDQKGSMITKGIVEVEKHQTNA